MNKSPEIEAFYTSRRWRSFRKSYLQKVGGLCENCRKKGLIRPATEIHHKIRITEENVRNPKITLNFDNVRALCDECHDQEHRKKRWRCDPFGRVRL